MHYLKYLAAAGLCALAAATPARAQIASVPPNLETPGWSFAVTPYAWLPTIWSQMTAGGPRGGTVNTSVQAGIGDYISAINFAAMVGGAARYDRFSVMTDLVYTNLSLTTTTSHLSSVNPGPGPIYIPREDQLGTGTRLAMAVWSLAGGYTLLQGDWGNLDAVAGMRMLSVDSTTNYYLNRDIIAPDRTIALSRGGSLNVGKTYFNAIGGVTGRINIPDSEIFLPFYADAGGGGVPLTWQAYAGIGYNAASWADVSVGYRYLAFENNNSIGVHNMSMGGVIFVANFRF